MNRPLKEILLPFIPPVAVSFYRKRRAKYSFAGDYPTWEDALRDASGYDDDLILQKVKEALLKVKRGEAAFERDSVLFDTPEYQWPLLSALLWLASRSNNELRLIDFGGSLGSTYFQNRLFLQHITDLRWNVVEQARYVECGKKHFTDNRLRFFETLDEARNNSNVILLSSVLPYVREPYALLDEVVQHGIQFVLIDRTPFIDGTRDRLTVQTVSPEIYPATYPAWFLSKKRFLDFMAKQYKLIVEFNGFDQANVPAVYLGMIFEKRS